MEMDLEGLHCIAKDHSRGIGENSMAKQSSKKRTSLEVHVMFEATRLGPEYLQEAYAWVIPCARKRLSRETKQPQLRSEVGAPQAERNAQ